ncbi:MAG: trigger factor [Eubacteriaceae bacterium]|nr:trigger factor [Eubacteriaceae bacterium]
MPFEIVNIANNVATVKMTIPKDDFQDAIIQVYENNKERFSLPGFRKGKVPRNVLEARYGKSLFYEEAFDIAIGVEYKECLEKFDFEVASSPQIASVDQLDDDGIAVTLEIPITPQFELKDYKGIKVGPIDYEVDEEEIDEKIAELLEQNSRLVSIDEGVSDNGTVAAINFEGFMDGVPFEGGKAEDFSLTIGAGNFIPGFEEQLIGHKAGDEFEIDVTFPEQYQSEDLAGKAAMFKIKILELKRKELPVLDDEFALDLGFDDLAGLRADAKEKVKQENEQNLMKIAKDRIVEELVESYDFPIAPQIITERAAIIKESNENSMRQQGVDPQQFYELVAQSAPNGEYANFFEAQYAIEADKSYRTMCIFSKLIEAENISITDEEFDIELQKLANAEQRTLEEVKGSMSETEIEYYKQQINESKLLDLLLEYADKSPEALIVAMDKERERLVVPNEEEKSDEEVAIDSMEDSISTQE